MKAKSLTKTNPFLMDQKSSSSRMTTCVSSSTAIETGETVRDVSKKLSRYRSTKRFAVKLA